ncbi:MAG: c-type cytochrome [Chloroflexi bacterium]|nr:c-type cytochrome [Chloroflexota bacterium]
MRGSIGSGLALLIIGVGGAMAMVFMLYAWDVQARAAESALKPSAPAGIEAQPSAPASSGAGLVAGLDSAAVSAGATLFAASCSSCHPGGNAGVGPALHGEGFLAQVPSAAAIAAKIRSGGGEMPPFGTDQLSDQDVANIAAYIMSLNVAVVSPTAPPPASRPAAAPTSAPPAASQPGSAATPAIPNGALTSTAPSQAATPRPSGPLGPTPVIPGGTLPTRSPAQPPATAAPVAAAIRASAAQAPTPAIPAGPLPTSASPVSSASRAGTPAPTPSLPGALPSR